MEANLICLRESLIIVTYARARVMVNSGADETCQVFTDAPVFLRSDNGSEFTAQAVQTWLEQNKVGPAFIPPGQLWKKGFIESFHDKFRDECLQREWLQSLLEAHVVIETWRLHYTALGHKLRFFRKWKAQFVTVGII